MCGMAATPEKLPHATVDVDDNALRRRRLGLGEEEVKDLVAGLVAIGDPPLRVAHLIRVFGAWGGGGEELRWGFGPSGNAVAGLMHFGQAFDNCSAAAAPERSAVQ